MSEQKDAQPMSGFAAAENAGLSWTLAGQMLRYAITVETPNACYSAGTVVVETTAALEVGIDLITLKATVDHANAICAQALKQVIFQGEHKVLSSRFKVRALVVDQRTGRTNALE